MDMQLFECDPFIFVCIFKKWLICCKLTEIICNLLEIIFPLLKKKDITCWKTMLILLRFVQGGWLDEGLDHVPYCVLPEHEQRYVRSKVDLIASAVGMFSNHVLISCNSSLNHRTPLFRMSSTETNPNIYSKWT